jgi:hypothetical protein
MGQGITLKESSCQCVSLGGSEVPGSRITKHDDENCFLEFRSQFWLGWFSLINDLIITYNNITN